MSAPLRAALPLDAEPCSVANERAEGVRLLLIAESRSAHTVRWSRLLASRGFRVLVVSQTAETIPGWDSLTHIHLIMALEAEFGVSFAPEQAVELTSIAAIRAALGALGVGS